MNDITGNVKPNVLIVDDRPENLYAMQHILSGLEAGLFTAASGNEALALTIHRDFALILLDVQMPDMDGYEVASLLRERDATANVPIIFVTAINKDKEHIFKGYEAGAVDYLFKPVDPEILRAKVEVFMQLDRQQRELAEKNQELDEFVYVASHDLQEPIRKLISFSQLLREDVGDDLSEAAEEDLTSIVDASTRMKVLIQDLLRLSRAGRAALQHEHVSLDECVDAAVDVMEVRIEELGASIVRDELPDAIGDRTVLTQLYQNLLSNALKFVEKGTPVVRFTANNDDGTWILGVQDNGIGMKPEFSEEIFKPFKRLHNRTEYAGTGVGLSICKKAVTRHGGRIWVESDLGQGSHFKFTLKDIQVKEGSACQMQLQEN